jgi:hypothetical protein
MYQLVTFTVIGRDFCIMTFGFIFCLRACLPAKQQEYSLIGEFGNV